MIQPMNSTEKNIVDLAEAIKAGKVSVTGSIVLVDVGYDEFKMVALDAPHSPPDYVEYKMELTCRRKTDE